MQLLFNTIGMVAEQCTTPSAVCVSRTKLGEWTDLKFFAEEEEVASFVFGTFQKHGLLLKAPYSSKIDKKD